MADKIQRIAERLADYFDDGLCSESNLNAARKRMEGILREELAELLAAAEDVVDGKERDTSTLLRPIERLARIIKEFRR